MDLYETPAGDRWVCQHCALEIEQKIKDEKWEYIFDRHEQDLICSVCGEPEFLPDD